MKKLKIFIVILFIVSLSITLFQHDKKIVYGFWRDSIDPTEYQPNWKDLTHVAYFAWNVKSDGSLNTPNITRYNEIKNYTKSNGVDLILVIQNFNPDIEDNIFTKSKENFTNNVINILQIYGADGINLDFEDSRTLNNITGEQNSILFEQLMKMLYTSLKSKNPNYHISFDISGHIDEIYRNKNLSQYVDSVFLMGYDYHWSTTSKTGAVSPYDDPNQLDVIDSVNILKKYYSTNKIILGLPFYGIKWATVSGDESAVITAKGEHIGMESAKSQAQIYGRIWDSKSHTPWLRYKSNGIWYQTWYDDEESLSIKFDYINRANLEGVGFWALGHEGNNSNIWNIINLKFLR